MQRKVPLPGKIFTPCVPERRFAGLFGCIARISCHSQLISDAWRANLAANWRFSRLRPLLGCMERKTCHGLPPGNAPCENIATASQAKSASGRNPATVGRRGNAFREHFAIVERLGTYQDIILPRPDAHAECPVRPCATAPAWPTAVAPSAPRLPTSPDIPTPLNCGCCRRFGRWRWHNPLIVALLPSGS